MLILIYAWNFEWTKKRYFGKCFRVEQVEGIRRTASFRKRFHVTECLIKLNFIICCVSNYLIRNLGVTVLFQLRNLCPESGFMFPTYISTSIERLKLKPRIKVTIFYLRMFSKKRWIEVVILLTFVFCQLLVVFNQ